MRLLKMKIKKDQQMTLKIQLKRMAQMKKTLMIMMTKLRSKRLCP